MNRIEKYKRNHFLFMHDFRVPFDDNMSERDLRKTKNCQKMASGFHKTSGHEMYCRKLTVHGFELIQYIKASSDDIGFILIDASVQTKDELTKDEKITVEYKTCQYGIQEDVYETVCSFSNRYGRYIIMGAEYDGTLIGINRNMIKT